MTILVPIADTAHREAVLDVAVELGRGLGQDLYVVHVVADGNAGTEAKRIRDELRGYLEDASVPGTVALEHVGRRARRPATTIARDLLELAEDVEITHIVMGHTEKGPIESLARGSTVDALVDQSPVPVTVVSEHV